ncbi:MAG TPA: acyl dehydratase [Gammaproteobacteria bacterium]|nr:acyl dehydratase [Gammaproteobacteria bacterium]
MNTLYFEDYDNAWSMETTRRTISEYDIMQFVTLVGLREPLFLDMQYLQEETDYERRLAPGSLTFSYAEGLVIGSGMLEGTGMAYLGGDSKILGPVYVDDTIHVELALHDKRETSKKDRGIVTTYNRVYNQSGDLVLEYWPKRMIRRHS